MYVSAVIVARFFAVRSAVLPLAAALCLRAVGIL